MSASGTRDTEETVEEHRPRKIGPISLSMPPAFRYREYRNYWFGMLSAVGGFQIAMFGQFWLIHELTGSTVYLGYVGLANAIPAIIAGIAEATLGKTPVDWSALVENYDRIRELIQDTIPGFENFNERLKHPGGFYLGNPARERQWRTASGRARLAANPLPESLVDAQTLAGGAQPELVLQTLRSHDQYNTTIYGLNDRYRGVHNGRKVLFANRADIDRLGFQPGDKIDLISLWRDGVERRVRDFTLLDYDVPAGQAAAYYPETNPLVPMDSYGDGSFTPTSKFIAIRLEKSSAPARIA